MIVKVTRMTRLVGIGWSDTVVTYPDPKHPGGTYTHVQPPRCIEFRSTPRRILARYEEIKRIVRGRPATISIWLGNHKATDTDDAINKFRLLDEETASEVRIEAA